MRKAKEREIRKKESAHKIKNKQIALRNSRIVISFLKWVKREERKKKCAKRKNRLKKKEIKVKQEESGLRKRIRTKILQRLRRSFLNESDSCRFLSVMHFSLATD